MSVTVLDGGFSTQLAKYVGDIIDGHPLWSARFLDENPEAVYKTHLDFFRAGAEVVITNSYQASIDGFVKYLNKDRSESIELIRESVRLAQKARATFMEENAGGRTPLIAGSVGSYGASLHDGSEYTGCFAHKMSAEELRNWHRPRIETLLAAGVDFLAIETIPVLQEAQVLLDLLMEYPQAKAWLSFQCKDGERTAHGEKFSDAVQACWKQNARQLLAVGCNCLDPHFISPLLKSASSESNDVPFVVYPNSGEKYTPESGWSGKEERPDLSEFIDEWLDLGAKYVGGCCRTDASDVKIIKKIVSKYNYNHIL